MQKVISSLRPTALRTCRCAHCATPNGGTVARRAGTVAGNGLRPTLLTSTTILCSSIFTAAAMIDADSKTRRRQQWDDAILGLEQEIVAVKSRNESAESMLVDPSKDWLDLAIDSEQWPVNTGLSLDEGRFPSLNSIYLPAESQVQGHWTPKKTAIVNINTRRLQLLLLRLVKQEKYSLDQLLELNTSAALLDLLTKDGSLEDSSVSSNPSTARNSALQQWLGMSKRVIRGQLGDLELDIRRIWKAQWDLQDLAEDSKDSWLTDYAIRKPSHHKILELNSRLREIFRATDASVGSRYLCLALVGHTLATSGTAPNLSTYNILLAGLSKLEIRYATSYAIHSLRRCNLRPNEATLSIVLQHYMHVNDRAGFDRWLDIIRGDRGGLSLAAVNEDQEEADIAQSPRFKYKPGLKSKVIELPCPTPKVFSAIVAGKLYFDGMDAALETCRKMGTEGWGISLDALGPLLRDCVRRKDLVNGEQIWKVARQLQTKAQKMHRERHNNTIERIPQHVYAAMLRLYEGAGANTQYMLTKHEFERVWPASAVPTTDRSTRSNTSKEMFVVDDQAMGADSNQPIASIVQDVDNAAADVLSPSSTSAPTPSTYAEPPILPTSVDTWHNKCNDAFPDDPLTEEALSSSEAIDRPTHISSTKSQLDDTTSQARQYRRKTMISLRPGMLHGFAYTPAREQQPHYMHAA